MKTWMGVSAGLVAGAALWSGSVLAQPKPMDCPKTAEKVEGQITKVDVSQGKLTMKGNDGKTYEFSASKDTLQDKKVGDHLEITKRMPEGCKAS
jgi:hypothetical protein